MKIDNEEMNEIIVEVHIRDKLDIEFDICIVSECESVNYSSNNVEESSDEEDDRF